jgi:CBS domain-containing protein
VEVGDICSRDMVAIAAPASLTDAAQIMRKEHVGMLVVTEPMAAGHDSKVVGVLTDRDIVTAVVAKQADPNTLTVGDVMTRNPLLANEAHSLGHVLRLMREIGVRRVPVLGAREQLVGILSLDDVLGLLATELGDVSQAIHSGPILERHSRP